MFQNVIQKTVEVQSISSDSTTQYLNDHSLKKYFFGTQIRISRS